MSEEKIDVTKEVTEPVAQKKTRQKLFHITKRVDTPLSFKVAIRAISIFTALIVCAFVLLMFKPGKFGIFFSESFNAFAGSSTKFLNTLYEFAVLLGITVAILPCFKMKFLNLGAEGQVLIGGLAAALISKYVGPSGPNVICVMLMIIAAMLCSAIWALIPAFFKAKFNTNETLFTLMMNYIAMGLIVYFAFVVNPSHGTFAGLTNGVFDFKNSIWYSLIPFFIVVAMTGFIFVYLNFTKQGYELSVVGEARNTAKYVGINVNGVIIRTAIVSGLLCGLIGYFVVSKQTSIEQNVLGGRGFTAVMIAWLGHMNVLEILLMAFLVAFITRGSAQVATRVDLGTAFTKITIATFLIVILAFEFFLNYEIHLNRDWFKPKFKKVEEDNQ